MHTHVDSNKILINKSENRATQDLVLESKMERVLEFLDVMKLARLAAVYACSELLNTVMLIPMLVMCIYQSRLKERVVLFAQDWVNVSTDKLGALAWSPRVAIEVCRRVFKRLLNEVGNGIQTNGDLDACFFLGKVYQARNDFTETVTYLMSRLFVHYAHVRSKIKPMTLLADTDAATHKIHRICCGSTVDAASVVSLILSKTVQQRYLICCRYRDLFKQSLTECVKNTSEYGVLLQILSSTLEQVEAEMLREATTEVEIKRDSTFSVVMARSNAEVALQKKTYEETFGEDLLLQTGPVLISLNINDRS
ncbi:hypothetical protein PsorP6_001140 [Peronosclerospora sorghi]|uniref:Uncharacterized protein n=1 Tax=Peronosclerospora sorghi TaxID=230839 RepID=A0ACC0WR60_9STRA|nr:hypothetical protein PsorP6_001140 [Peronosclerospora sorghi]